MKNQIEQLEKVAGLIEVESLAMANTRDQINILYRQMEDLAYASDEANAALIRARESMEEAIRILSGDQ
jgi:hypothetical protein